MIVNKPALVRGSKTIYPTILIKAILEDLTYIATGEGWLYLAGLKNYGSQELVGYVMGSRMAQEDMELTNSTVYY